MQRTILTSFTLVACVLVSSPSNAQLFGVLSCPTQPSYQEINFPLSASATHLPQINPPFATMTNNINDEKFIYSSANVRSMSLNFVTFSTEQNFDYAYWGEKNSSFYVSMTGTLPNNTLVPAFVSKNFNETPGSFRVITDSSVGSTGYEIDKVRVSCGPSPALVTPPLNMGTLHMGVLLGTNDSIFFQTPVVSGQNVNVILTGTNSTDFDLYARCNATPTKTVYTARSYSGDSNEFLSLPSGWCPGGIWYIVVNSYSGAGGFTLLPSRGFESENLSVRALVQHTSPTEVDSTANMLAQGVRRFYGTTLGAILPVDIKVCGYFNWSCGQQIVTRRYDCSRSFADAARTPGNPVDHFAMCTTANIDTIPHEMGHTILGLGDEYNDVNGAAASRCGHSRMAGTKWFTPLCYSGDHNKDYQTNTTPTGFVTSGWDRWPNAFIPSSMIPTKTPPSIDFSNHDFNDQIPVLKYYSPP